MALYRIVEKNNRYLGTYNAETPEDALEEAKNDFKYSEELQAFEVSSAQ